MKILFVGEGRHDIGDSSGSAHHPRQAQGTIPTLARRICPQIAEDSLALSWSEVQRFNPAAKKDGYPAKIVASALLAVRKFGCAGTVVVADRDRVPGRQAEMEDGVILSRELFPDHPAVWGLAFESVEAWTLGAPDKIALVLGIEINSVHAELPSGVHVEDLFQKSGKPDHRPKGILQRIAQLKHRHDSTAFREEIAMRTEMAALAKACPKGFKPFAEQMQKAFAPKGPATSKD